MDYYAKYKKYKNKYRYINLLFGGWFDFDNTKSKKFTFKRHRHRTGGPATTGPGHITPGGFELESILNYLYNYFNTNNKPAILGIITDPNNTFRNSRYAKPAKANINSLHTGYDENDMNGGIQRILSTIGHLPDINFILIYGLLKLSYDRYTDSDIDIQTEIDSHTHILIRTILNNKIESCSERYYRIQEYNLLTSYNFIESIHKYNKQNHNISKNQLRNLRRDYKNIIINKLIAEGIDLKGTIDEIIDEDDERQSDEIVRNHSLCYDILLERMPALLYFARDKLIDECNQNTLKSEKSYVEDSLNLSIDESADDDDGNVDDSVDTEKPAIESNQSEKDNFSAEDISLEQLAKTISHYEQEHDGDDGDDIYRLQQKIMAQTTRDELRREIRQSITKKREEEVRKQGEKHDQNAQSYFKQKQDNIAVTDKLVKQSQQMKATSQGNHNLYAVHEAREDLLQAVKHLEKLQKGVFTDTPEIINAKKEVDEKKFIYTFVNIRLQFMLQLEVHAQLIDVLEPYKVKGYDSDLSEAAKLRIVQSHSTADAGDIIQRYRVTGERAGSLMRALVLTDSFDVELINKMGTAKLTKQFRKWVKIWKDLSKMENLIQLLDIASILSKQTMVEVIVTDIDKLKKTNQGGQRQDQGGQRQDQGGQRQDQGGQRQDQGGQRQGKGGQRQGKSKGKKKRK